MNRELRHPCPFHRWCDATEDTHTTDTRLLRAVARLYMETPIEVLDRFEQLYPEDAKVLGDLIIN